MDRQIITVDIAPEVQSDRRLKVSQYDVGRPLGVYIEQDGVPLNCSAYEATLYVLKPDRNYYEHVCTVDANEHNLICWETAEQETPVAGVCLAEIRITSNGEDIGTANFTEWVEESPTDIGLASDSAIESIRSQVKRAEEAANAAEEAVGSYDAMTAEAETLEAGSQATASIDRSGDHPVLTVGIPAGDKGDKGDAFTYSDFTEEQKAELVQGPIQSAQTAAVNAVQEESTRQVQEVNTAGATQKQAVEDKGQEVLDSIPADYSDLTEEVADLNRAFNDLHGGATGQVLRKRSNADYAYEWASVGQPTDEQTAKAVSDWLDDHPEATTTVQDGSLTEAKFTAQTLSALKNNYVTPQMYGAVADGITDDTTAIQQALNSGLSVFFPTGTYLTSGVTISRELKIQFDAAILKAKNSYQDFIIKVDSVRVFFYGDFTVSGDSKAYTGIQFLNSNGSYIQRVTATFCLAFGVYLYQCNGSHFGIVVGSYCGKRIELSDVSRESNYSIKINDELSELYETLLSSKYAVSMVLYDTSGFVDGGPNALTRLINSFDHETNLLAMGQSAANATGSLYVNKSCNIYFGGALYLSANSNAQIIIDYFTTSLCSVGLCCAATYGHVLNAFYSQSDGIPMFFTGYSLGWYIGSYTIEGSRTGYEILSYYYNYSVIGTRSTGGRNNSNTSQIVSIVNGTSDQNPVNLSSLSLKLMPAIYFSTGSVDISNTGRDTFILGGGITGLQIKMNDPYKNMYQGINPWGVKTAYLLAPSSGNDRIFKIKLSADVISAGYSIKNGTNGELAFTVTGSAMTKITIVLNSFNNVFWAFAEAVSPITAS